MTRLRTAEWMEQQIMHPDVMTREDPIAHSLLQSYLTQMPNMGLSREQARDLIEFVKRRDHELSAVP